MSCFQLSMVWEETSPMPSTCLFPPKFPPTFGYVAHSPATLYFTPFHRQLTTLHCQPGIAITITFLLSPPTANPIKRKKKLLLMSTIISTTLCGHTSCPVYPPSHALHGSHKSPHRCPHCP